MGTLSALLPAVLLLGSLSEPRTVNLFDGSREVFESHWREKKLRRPLTRYEVVEDGDEAVLMAQSRKSASAVWRELKLDPFQTGSITWRWKVARSLAGDQDERQKAGDDYAARVYVFFGRVPFGRKTRGSCYVWAGTQPVGSAYPSPYSDHIVTIVVRSGDALAGRWSTEERDLVEDYERHVRFDANARTVHLSKIFDWFKDDFLDHERANGHEKPRLIDYVNRYRAPGAAIPPDSRVRFLEYDKQINRQPPSRTAARAGERNATR